VVDGNVYRVLSRYFGVELPIDSTEGKKYFAFLADEMLDKNNPGRHNQAMMDFGALQCVPHSPDCLACPLAEGCEAFRRGCVGALPVKQHKTKVTNRFFNYIYVRMGAYTFINKRQGNDIWRNLFEFPLIETYSEVSPQEFATLPQVRELLHADDVDVPFKLVRRGVKHVLSHRVIYANFYEISLPEASLSFSKFKRISISEIEDYPVSRLMHAFIEKYV
jgi:A/G-specific adenine glycosylase